MPSECTLSISGFRPLGKLLLVHIPVAQAGMVVFALAKPAVVHHEAVNAQGCGLLRQRHLSGLAHVECRSPPRSCKSPAAPWAAAGRRWLRAGQNVLELVAMQQPRSAAQPMRRVPAIENRRLQLLSRLQDVAEVEGIEAAGDAHRIQLVLLDRDAPRPAPSQRAKPHLAMVLVRLAALNRKPWIGLVARGAAPALDHPRSRMHRLLGQRPLPGPAPGQVVQRVVRRPAAPMRRRQPAPPSPAAVPRGSRWSPTAPEFRSPDPSRSAA